MPETPITFDDTVACIWVRTADTRMQLSIDPIQDRIPYSRPLLVRALRALADSLEDEIADSNNDDRTPVT